MGRSSRRGRGGGKGDQEERQKSGGEVRRGKEVEDTIEFPLGMSGAARVPNGVLDLSH